MIAACNGDGRLAFRSHRRSRSVARRTTSSACIRERLTSWDIVAAGREVRRPLHSPDETRPVRTEPNGLAPYRERAQCRHQPARGRLLPAAHRRHGSGAERHRAREEAILRDLEWLDFSWDERPATTEASGEGSTVPPRSGSAATASAGRRSSGRTERPRTTWRASSTARSGVTHVYRGNDHRPNEDLHRRLHQALGTTPPEYVHHGLILGEDGKKLSKRAEGATVASLRGLGIPAEAVRGYLDELGPLAPSPLRPAAYPPPLRRRDRGHERRRGGGARGDSSRSRARSARRPRPRGGARLCGSGAPGADPIPTTAPETLERFRELADAEPKAVVRSLAKAVGGNLRALRLALTGRDRGPELAAILAALREEALRRVDQALQHSLVGSTLPEPPGPVRMYFWGRPSTLGHIGNAPSVRGRMWLELARARVRGDARPQHHGHQRQDLRSGRAPAPSSPSR